MYLSTKELNLLIEIENKLARNKKYYNEFCVLSTMIENKLNQKREDNKKTWAYIKEKRKTNKNYGRTKTKGD